MKTCFFLLALFFSNAMLAQDAADSTQVEDETQAVADEAKHYSGPNDSTSIRKKEFDQDVFQKLKSDKSLRYSQATTVGESLWDRFLTWLSYLIMRLFQSATGTGIGRLLLYAGAIGLMVVVVMMLLRVNAFRAFFGGADSGKTEAVLFHENIHEMDFEKLIREAVERHEYRQGVRLVFLHALKILSDKHLIDFQAGKTNHDYVEELKTRELKAGLDELSYYFDYAWYGGFVIGKETFSKVETTFRAMKTKVS